MKDQRQFDPFLSVLTAGRDRHYTLGFASALAEAGQKLDFIGSDDLESDDLRASACVRFLNLRGDQSLDASLPKKTYRVLAYYLRLLHYAATARSIIFHILWNNKFEFFDRTALMAFYKMLGKKIALTAHNVNAGVRDGYDSFLNRATLKFQYRLCDRIFVHTEKMRAELISDFNVSPEKIVLIPYGWNNVVPNTAVTGPEARERLGLSTDDKALLFYGNIAPYKGVEFLVEAFNALANEDSSLRLIIAGRPRGPKTYWEQIQAAIKSSRHADRIIQRIEYISEADTELYFKAADVLVLPYVCIFQSGVLFLSYSFGLPVIATDAGSLKEAVLEGQTGFTCTAGDSAALARCIRAYFQSNLYRQLEARRPEVQHFVKEKHSWNQIANIIIAAYSQILSERDPGLVSKIEKHERAISLNSHSGLQR